MDDASEVLELRGRHEPGSVLVEVLQTLPQERILLEFCQILPGVLEGSAPTANEWSSASDHRRKLL